MNFSLYLIISVLLPLSACLSGLLNYRSLNITGKLIVSQLFLAALTELVGSRLSYLKIPNVSIFNTYMMLEFLLLGIAPLFLTTDRRIKIAIIGLLVFGLSFHTYNLVASGLGFFANRSMVLYGFIIAVLYFYTLIKTIQDNTDKRIRPLAMICIAHIIYFIGCIPFFGLFHVVQANYPGVFEGLFQINFVLSILRYLLIALSFYLWSDKKFKLSKASSYDR